MPDRPTTTDRRDKTLHELRVNLNQDSAWRAKVLDILGELMNDNKKLRQGYANLKLEVERMRQ